MSPQIPAKPAVEWRGASESSCGAVLGARPSTMRPPGATGDLLDLLWLVRLWKLGLAGLLVSKEGLMNKPAGVKVSLHMLGWKNNANS